MYSSRQEIEMKYLAFDIEAANGYRLSSICSVGIVIADEQFNILSRQNIWINPKTKYNLNGTRENVGIDLHLDKKLLDSSPDFKHAFGQIRDLLTDKQYFVFGHAVDADVRMLNATCERYHLPCIEFEFADSQLLFRLYKGEKEVKSLSKIATEIGVEFAEHNSEEDAYATMRTLAYLVKVSGLTVEELLDKYRVRKGSNRRFEITRPVSLDGQVPKKRVTQIAWDKIKTYASAVQKVSNRFKNAGFSLSRSLELSDSETLYKVVERIVQNGGRYVTKLAKSKVYVSDGASSQQDVLREKRVDELAEQGLLIKIDTKKFLEEIL